MRLTTKGRYAVTAMLDLALHDQGAPTTLADIADRQGLSLSYLEQLFSQLRRAGLVKSVRGPGGGYRLARATPDISIDDIILAVDEEVDVTRCGGLGNCQNGHKCLGHHLWQGLSQQIRGFLQGIHLADLIKEPQLVALAALQDQDLARVRATQAAHPLRGDGLRHK
ncbi:Rrf2 family transcriptional regulator [Halothiobacillus sp. DCM-1]|uniref:Rrf2 family transcriptional regulator n=1 Tax=Halothiobacillus sp. DCM-1 TaxID=3112558 RepID=UPI0032493269